MRWFATCLALGTASVSLLACGGSHSVDFFSGSGGTPGVSGSNTGSSASAGAVASAGAGAAGAGQSFAGSTSAGSSSGVGGSSSLGGGDGGGADSAAGSSSGTAGAPGDGTCAPVADIASGMSFANAGPVCLRVTLDIAGWGCSNFEGRTLKVNGTTVACAEFPLPSKLDGAYYFEVSAGEHEYASLYWY
jgi:endoglucanase